MKNKRTTLFHSIIALLLCVSMLVGTTFAWFTDSVKTGINTIAAGNLDVELYHSNAAASNERVGSNTKLFMDLQGDPILWEPGVVSYENLCITNEGNLALAYQLAINTANENFVVDGSDLYGLSQILKVGVVEGGITATDRAGVLASVKDADWTTFANFLRSGSLLPEGAGTSEETWGIVIYWEPGDNDNFWNLNNAKQLSEGDVLSIDLGIKLVATQEIHENDSFGNNYDVMGGFNKHKINLNVSIPVSVTVTGDGKTEAPMSLGNASVGVNAEIPAGIALADGAASLTLSVKTLEESQANITLDNGERQISVDVHIDGVAEDNTVPMLVTMEGLLPTGLNSTGVALYHVEGGQTVTMTQTENTVNHNEYSYDAATGTVVVALASFSEVAAIADTSNPWDGTTATAYTGTGTESDPYLIANAEQLAYFRNQVDGGNTFEGKYVKLNDNINLNGKNFDPIGWGYSTTAHNRDGVAGKTFNGTFDGNGKTIYGLYQNGWDLEASTGTDYTYTNCGFGLFATASNATFKNLTISGADIRVECVEAGVLVGLSQNSCTYDNINIYNSKIANYQRPAGGLIGEVSGSGETNIDNVTIGSDVVVGSMWGDFDTPVGGVIGARWDDANKDPQINMVNVNVACKLDVYSDVTAAYQWYAYRRAGMLIGNTDTPPADGKNAKTATADFLKCEGVTVRYGGWIDYHYCEFTNENNPGKGYPWVRAEAGENCSAYSNPRYGHPTAPDGTVVNADHTAELHQGAGEHWVSIPFGQLYGGGQGVYGGGQTDEYVSTHEGVTIESYDYSVTYMDRGEVFAVDYVKNDTVYTVKHSEYVPTRTESPFKAWVNAGGTKVDSIKAGNETDYVLYDSWHSVYTARFVDQEGNVIYEEEFSTSQTRLNEPAVPAVDGGFTGAWEEYDLTTATGDITIKPVYNADNGIIKLEPVDNEPQDGIIDYYKVTNVTESDDNVDIVIPSELNGIPVQEVSNGAFAEFDNITTVTIPTSIKSIGADAFANKENSGFLGAQKYEQITFIYEGTKAQWDAIDKDENWDQYIGGGSKIYFLADGTYSEMGQNFLGRPTSWGTPQKGTYSA